jgi:hypothetical protein
MDEKTNAMNGAGSTEKKADDFANKLPLAELAPADMQALAEKVMALLKRDLQIERERFHGR